jgi:hypothetical protein
MISAQAVFNRRHWVLSTNGSGIPVVWVWKLAGFARRHHLVQRLVHFSVLLSMEIAANAVMCSSIFSLACRVYEPILNSVWVNTKVVCGLIFYGDKLTIIMMRYRYSIFHLFESTNTGYIHSLRVVEEPPTRGTSACDSR